MNLQEMYRMAEGGETLHVEFKRKLPTWDKLAREVCALANTAGGTVLIGVDDSGEIVGIRDHRAVEEALAIQLPRYLRPAPDFEMETVPLTRKRAVVVLHIPMSQAKPHRALQAPDDEVGTVLIRIADSSARAGREMIDLLKYEGREKNMRVEYGEKEALLMKLLEKREWITVQDFADAAGIKPKSASVTLTHLVKARVLKITPQVEKPDRFSLLQRPA